MSFISLTKVLPAVLSCAAERFDALVMVKPQFEVGRERIGKGGVVRDPALRREALVGVAAAARDAGAAVLGFAPVGAAGARRQPRDVRVAGGGRAAGRAGRPRRGRRRGGGLMRTATVLTHRRASDTSAGARRARRGGRAARA